MEENLKQDLQARKSKDPLEFGMWRWLLWFHHSVRSAPWASGANKGKPLWALAAKQLTFICAQSHGWEI